MNNTKTPGPNYPWKTQAEYYQAKMLELKETLIKMDTVMERQEYKLQLAHKILDELKNYSTGMSVLSEERVEQLVQEFEA